ncbi:ribokinase [Maledivibacter halophilus]|uniref:Ribokinase n=1 Tax=Maledivibacter halophilus TaxID=36842 RepID=A0A1T5M610_9FIRM|nr:ribokinase [Maledivibacter halophilus]SKC83563.1 ribokinase [Maledivibacter halophilus]
MKNILVIGSINMDMVIRVSHIPAVGETILAKDVKSFGGGKGANQAIAAARLDGNVSMIGRVGNDEYGKQSLENLKSSGVNVEGIEIDDNTQTGTAYIYVSDKGENNIVVYAGANEKLSVEQVKRFNYLFDSAEFCVIQLEIPLNVVEFVINLCNKKGVKVIFNPAPACDLSEDVLKNTYILTPNETELAILTGQKTDTISNIESASYKMMERGVENIITTIGDKGSFFVNKGIKQLHEAIKVDSIDTTAAGDSFTGALAVALAEEKEIGEAINFATHVAAITVTKEGAQTSLPMRKEVEEIMNKSDTKIDL